MTPHELTRAMLVVIDMQRYFLDRGAPAFLNQSAHLIPNVVKLCNAFREARRPVVFTRHAHIKGAATGQMGRWWKEHLPWEGDADAALVEDIVPRPDEALLTKTTYSAFEGTGLEDILARRMVATIVVCGVTTNLCVETTARHAFIRDIQPVVVVDACAAKSEEFHCASLKNLSYGFAHLHTTEEIVAMCRPLHEREGGA